MLISKTGPFRFRLLVVLICPLLCFVFFLVSAHGRKVDPFVENLYSIISSHTHTHTLALALAPVAQSHVVNEKDV